MQPLLDLAKRPLEAEVSEGNIVENPLFVLHNRDAKPPNKEDYTRTLVMAKEVSGSQVVERSIVIAANPRYGYPTMFAYRLLVALIDEARQQGFKESVVYVTRHELATRLGIRRPAKSDYADIENALNAMASMRIEFKNSWYDIKTKERKSLNGSDGLLHSFKFFDARQGKKTLDARALVGMEGGATRSYVKLGDDLFQSLKAGYFNGVDLDYMNALRQSPLAVRLYSYLTKKNSRSTYREDLKLLASKLNLRKKAPSAIRDVLTPPLNLLASSVPVGPRQEGRRFLESWSIPEEKNELCVTFFRPEAMAKK